jgi:hypothetical protein
MTAIAITNTDLRWDVLTVKRPGLTRDLPPGKEELRWVANSSTLIQGERDAVLVDTLLTTEQSKTLSDWVVASGKNLPHLYHPRPWRSFLWSRIASGAVPARQSGRDARGRQGHAGTAHAGLDRQLLASPFSRRYSGPPFGC